MDWWNSTFPADHVMTGKKMLEEAQEVVDALEKLRATTIDTRATHEEVVQVMEESLEELADVYIAHVVLVRRLGWSRKALMDAVEKKMTKNEARTWVPTGDGEYRHE